MGNKQAAFTESQLEQYQDCTFFTRKEILRIFRRYRDLDSDHIPKSYTRGEASRIKVPFEYIEKMPELKENPFRRRICEVFSEDGSGNMTFDDFLDMFSVFSEQAPQDIKAVYAFKIYGETVHPIKVNCCVFHQILEEADLDDDSQLSYMEFEHVISRAPDFLNTFHIRI
ncbi:PREDICTED: calcium and integrin-binding family member 3-like [Branchiostoma belcheri]|uniref:Calcium and integrin-binding family member 3-like n=1 Tax=Branchiostoma belcheri TaxID=7741 RepID=A0A6P5A9M9_BRABE|nr:PREDICTED: calcium and integrin-binding family member 3-like [Branchiostoma belcheri]